MPEPSPSQPPVLTLRGMTIGRPGATPEELLVRGVDLEVAPGERLGLVGESGCGKSLTALGILGLLPAGLTSSSHELEVRGRHGGAGRVAIVSQDPMGSLNPCFRVRVQLANVLRANTELRSKRDLRARSLELLAQVGMPNPQRVLDSFPHALSGGMRQRVMIAMALAAEPDLLIADEPTTALDVTIQAQVIELLDALCRDEGLALVLITHDMGVVSALCGSVAVMYGGQIVERGTVPGIFERSVHPYTAGLLASVPRLDTSRERPLATVPGQVPGDWSSLRGCRFAPRCREATDRCTSAVPELVVHGPGAAVRCWERSPAEPEPLVLTAPR